MMHLYRAARAVVTALTLATLAAAAPSPASSPVATPRVTEIRIIKSTHTLRLLAGDTVVRTYTVALGPGGPGPKRFEGDRRTPVGVYRVAGRVRGLFHQFLIVSYPNADDWARFRDLQRRGEVPPGHGIGSSIGIHGVGRAELAGVHKATDWTLGCVALDDDEIDEVARLAPDGTRIVITD